MNVEKQLEADGIIVTEKIDTELALKIAQNITKKIVQTFPHFELDEEEILGKLFSLNMYKADMPEGMAEANYCYKNSSIYFNSHISDEDLEEFAIHECIHFLQEKRDTHNKIKRMGLSEYSRFRVAGTGLNEASVQYISSKIIGIKPDFEKYYDINLYTPSPSYYPVECALLNELIYFIGEDILFRSTYFSTDELKEEIISRTSKKTFKNIFLSFDKILKCEEQIILLKNKQDEENSFQDEISILREDIKDIFIKTQNIIIKEFFDSEFNTIEDLEQVDAFRRKLTKFKEIVATTENYTFFEDYFLDTMNKLEHKSNILENGGVETAIASKHFSIFGLLEKLKDMLFYKKA